MIIIEVMMENNIKFIHCADIHLGANPFEIEERFEDMGKAFEQVCDFAVMEKVDFVLIAGDFFHSKVLNPRTLEQAINSLEKLKNENIPVFLTEGNHDMETYSNVYSWLQFLSSKGYIYLLRANKLRDEKLLSFWNGKEGSIFQTEKVDIVGLGYPGSTAKKYIERVNNEIEELINQDLLGDKPIICMLHTGIDRFLTEAMGGIREDEIESLLEKIDYLALGHIHKRYENVEKKYYNPGSIECVRITDNPFNKGFYYIKMNFENREVESEFKIVKNRNSIVLDVNVDDVEADECNEFICKKIQEEYEEKCEDGAKVMLQIKINGVAKQGTKDIDVAALKDLIASRVPVLRQEVMNLIRYVDEDEVVITNDIEREEIEKIVIKEKIEKAGIEEDEVERVYQIIDKMKEYGGDEIIDVDSTYGKDLERMLFDLIED